MKRFLIKEILVACLLSLSIFFTCNIVLAEEKITEDKIDINYATFEELSEMPYLTPEIAENIIFYREENDDFFEWEEFFDIKGIDAMILEKIKRDFFIYVGHQCHLGPCW